MSDVRIPNSILIAQENFLGETIQFRPDDRFVNQSLLSSSAAFIEANRDVSQHIVIEYTDNRSLYRLNLISPIFDRYQFKKTIDTTFTELDNA